MASAKMPRIAVVVPCYNESKRLRADRFRAFARERGDVKLVFVDDGSTDGTAAVLENIGRGLENVTSVTLARNRGKGEAVRAGILEALASDPPPQLFGYWDADLSTPLEALRDLESLFDDAAELEIVLGARVLLLGRDIVRLPSRHYFGRAFATVVSLLLGLAVYDTQCGAKLFRHTESTASLFREPFLSRWVFDVELLARYLRLGEDAPARIYEHPLSEWHHAPGSKIGLADLPRVALDLARIWVRSFSKD